jgi:alginate O-acetyltransferase complex protein AlgI
MLFVQYRFFVFFLVVFCVHWALRGNTSRKAWLLLCSHFFYACLFLAGPDSASAERFPPWTFFVGLREHQPLPTGWWFPMVLWGSTIMDYIVGLGIADAKSDARRRGWLLVSLGVNLGVLGFFKYANFGLDSVHTMLGWFGLHTSKHTLAIFLPYGISFYTFQSMSYSIDVYRRRLEPARRFIDLAFFISFFPQLVAGPIVRAMTFLPQVYTRRVWANVQVRDCLTLFFIGFVKKACLSDNISPIADAYFAAPQNYDLYSSFIGILFYGIQIYCDFSGYTDMAIACSRLLGYELTPNFNFPYFSASIADFWRRWHMSLSTWLRDYLYIPLGGNRGSKLFAYRNTMITMLLGGLWHGASWNFVFWGGANGLALVFHRIWENATEGRSQRFDRIMTWLGIPATFYFFLVTLVFIRARDVHDPATHQLVMGGTVVGGHVLKAICLLNAPGQESFTIYCLPLLLGLTAIHFANYRGWLSTWWKRMPYWAYAAVLALGWAVALTFVPARYQAFIYFQF